MKNMCAQFLSMHSVQQSFIGKGIDVEQQLYERVPSYRETMQQIQERDTAHTWYLQSKIEVERILSFEKSDSSEFSLK